MSPIVLGLIAVVLLNLAIFPIAFKLQTDKLTDITYCLSFLGLVAYGFFAGEATISIPKLMIAGLVILWAIRLAAYLFHRVSALGKDDRFDKIRTNPKRFFRFFMIQAVSAWVISLPFLYRLLFKPGQAEGLGDVSIIEWVGLIIAIVGLLLETIADNQKSVFKGKSGNKSKVFMGGLYSIVRYPNYLGEILFWIGIFIASIPAIYGIGWLSIVSPIIIILLLLFVTGIPMIEKKRMKNHGDDPQYMAYINEKKLIIPGIY